MGCFCVEDGRRRFSLVVIMFVSVFVCSMGVREKWFVSVLIVRFDRVLVVKKKLSVKFDVSL